MASDRLNVAHPILQFDIMRFKKSWGSNAKQKSTFTNP
jgi:hypothetical protein